MEANAHDFDDDYRDGALFRFWIRMAQYPGGKPSAVAKAIADCHTAAEYRKALTELAIAEGVNLP